MNENAQASAIPEEDLRLIRWLSLPVFLAFLFLGLIGMAEGANWLYWIMVLGGWYLSSLINWHSYRFNVIEKTPPERLKFYLSCAMGQITIIGVLATYLLIRYSP